MTPVAAHKSSSSPPYHPSANSNSSSSFNQLQLPKPRNSHADSSLDRQTVNLYKTIVDVDKQIIDELVLRQQIEQVLQRHNLQRAFSDQARFDYVEDALVVHLYLNDAALMDMNFSLWNELNNGFYTKVMSETFF